MKKKESSSFSFQNYYYITKNILRCFHQLCIRMNEPFALHKKKYDCTMVSTSWWSYPTGQDTLCQQEDENGQEDQGYDQNDHHCPDWEKEWRLTLW